LIDEYNAGSANLESTYEALLQFAQKLNEEDQRHVREEIFHPGSPCERVSALLEKVAPEMEPTQSSSEFTPNMERFNAKKEGFKSAITARNSFRDFIEREID
jgi:hypothetical protein